jgi:hypothetical protein
MGQMAARHVSIRGDWAFTVIGAHMAVNVQKSHEMSALIDTHTRELRAQLLGAMLRGKAGEPAPQRLHFRRAVEPEQSAERGRVFLLEMLGPLDAQQRPE